MPARCPDMDPEHAAELEDRAAEQVERDWRYGHQRDDRAQARADALAHDLAVLAARALADAELDSRYRRLYRHDVVGGET